MLPVTNIEDHKEHRIGVKHDGKLRIATGRNVKDTKWKNQEWDWSYLLWRMSESEETYETHAEFMALPKAEQDRIKDIGGFVGGSLKGGRRKAGFVENRQLVTLDADQVTEDTGSFLARIGAAVDGAYAVYSTHKHTTDKPRLRLVIPLSRTVSPDEHEAVARKLADKIGIDVFDDTTYEANRLMFWPSHPSDVEPVFLFHDEAWIDPDGILAEYPDWTDTSYWPESSRAVERRKKTADKQGDPTEKKGIIGAFCRTYTIQDAISTFLSDVYLPCENDPQRYTYAEGSTSGGLVVYDDKYAYSHHATDPASGNLCNAFDLVRIHKFGAMDEDAAPGAVATKLPSFKAMTDFCRDDPETKKTVISEKREDVKRSFDDEDSGDAESWEERIELDRKGNICASLNNARTIIQYDPSLKGIVYNAMADNLEIVGDVPWKRKGKFWRDADDAQLENYLAERYTEFSKAKILSAITKVADDRSYHPVRQYLESLPEWDGKPRVDELLIDYLGAEDNSYTRAVIRKTLCAAIRRVLEPGIKFDTVLVCCGPQGIGKSTFWAKLGGPWFSDSLNLRDTNDKTAAEKIQGVWIVEIQEMAGIGSAGVKTLRSFITTQNDRYRASYGRRVSEHPRQCILVGTTNSEEGYLNDVDGGRRFWPVNTPGGDILLPWDLTDEDVGQIWAEALEFVKSGESLTLSEEDARLAVRMQEDAVISDPREEMVKGYLERKLPGDWYKRTIDERRDFLYGSESPMPKAELVRRHICSQEIWVECFGRKLQDMRSADTYDIRRILMKLDGWKALGERRSIGGEYGRQRVFTKVD